MFHKNGFGVKKVEKITLNVKSSAVIACDINHLPSMAKANRNHKKQSTSLCAGLGAGNAGRKTEHP